MYKTIAFFLILALRLSYQPSYGQHAINAMGDPAGTSLVYNTKLIQLKGAAVNGKFMLEWSVDTNENAEQFEVERSKDGKHFKLAGLVFGSEEPAIGTYQFYEKAGNHKSMYRIKMISKDKKVAYSPVVEISPSV